MRAPSYPSLAPREGVFLVQNTTRIRSAKCLSSKQGGGNASGASSPGRGHTGEPWVRSPQVTVSGEVLQVNSRQWRSPVGKVAVLWTHQSDAPTLPQGREDQLHQL